MFNINQTIANARTLPAEFYLSDDFFDRTKERIFHKASHYIGSSSALVDHQYIPHTILPDFLNEPVIIIKDQQDQLSVMSNVCTHRGNLLVTEAGRDPILRCGYHGRCFGRDGRCRSMPGFEGVEDFPSPSDDLRKYDTYQLGPMLFASLNGGNYMEKAFAEIAKRMSGYRFDDLKYAASLQQKFELDAHWALYVDNYLEGFHVPFVHPGLNASLSMDEYHYETFDYHNLQLGIGNSDEACIELSPSSPEFGRNVFAYYWWVWPNLMINCYPWGVSLNLIQPVAKNKTRILFETYLFDLSSKSEVEASMIRQTELEDEEIVLQVQKGIESSAYVQGKYSPTHERCVHHFHQLIAKAL
jgi:choline monooxygenase